MFKSLRHSSFTALFCVLTLGTALGGTGSSSKSPGPAIPPPAGDESGGIEIEASVGYDSHYVFRGELLQKNTPWAEISITAPITDSLSFNLTPWYLYDVDTNYDEFDLLASFSYSLDKYELSLGYAAYFYPQGALGDGEGIDDEEEIFGSISTDLGPLSVEFLTAYSITRDGLYYELNVDLPYEASEKLTITPGVAVGADSDYFDAGTGFNHVSVRLNADYALTDSLTLSAYVRANFPFEHLSYAESDFVGGMQLTVGF
jgi:hypothetical protein